MVGKRREWSGIIRAGAKMVSAGAVTSVVPKITVIVVELWRGALAVMCGKAYDPRFILCVKPTARCMR